MAKQAVEALFVGFIFVLFLPVINGAVDDLALGGTAHGDELAIVLDQLPLLVALGALIVLGMAATRRVA